MTDYTDPDQDWTVNGRSLWQAIEVLGLFGDGASPAGAARVLLKEAGAEPADRAVRLPGWPEILDAINGVRETNDGHYGPDPEDLARGIATRLEAAALRSGMLVDADEPSRIRLGREAALGAISRVLHGLASGTSLADAAVAEQVLAALEETGAVQAHPAARLITQAQLAAAARKLQRVAALGELKPAILAESVFKLCFPDGETGSGDVPDTHAIDPVTLNDVLCEIRPDMSPEAAESLARDIAARYEVQHRESVQAMRAGAPVCTCEDDDPYSTCEVHGPEADDNDWDPDGPATTEDEAAARCRDIMGGLTPEHQYNVTARLIGDLPYADEVAGYCAVWMILSRLGDAAAERILTHVGGMLNADVTF